VEPKQAVLFVVRRKVSFLMMTGELFSIWDKQNFGVEMTHCTFKTQQMPMPWWDGQISLASFSESLFLSLFVTEALEVHSIQCQTSSPGVPLYPNAALPWCSCGVGPGHGVAWTLFYVSLHPKNARFT
jgi:hypothetical protein